MLKLFQFVNIIPFVYSLFFNEVFNCFQVFVIVNTAMNISVHLCCICVKVSFGCINYWGIRHVNVNPFSLQNFVSYIYISTVKRVFHCCLDIYLINHIQLLARCFSFQGSSLFYLFMLSLIVYGVLYTSLILILCWFSVSWISSIDL